MECVLKFLLESLARRVFIATLRLSVGQHSPKAGYNVDILIESTKYFEQDLNQLSQDYRKAVIQIINDFANLFPENDSSAYRKLEQPSVPLDLNGYDSSLYVLRAVDQLRVILTVDEDPIFDQVILNLFRVVDREDVETSYQDIAKALYQEISHRHREPAQIS